MCGHTICVDCPLLMMRLNEHTMLINIWPGWSMLIWHNRDVFFQCEGGEYVVFAV